MACGDDARDLKEDDGAADHGRKGGGGADEDDSIYVSQREK